MTLTADNTKPVVDERKVKSTEKKTSDNKKGADKKSISSNKSRKSKKPSSHSLIEAGAPLSQD